MERSMLGISLRDKKRSSWIRENTKVKDILLANLGTKVKMGRSCGKRRGQWMEQNTD